MSQELIEVIGTKFENIIMCPQTQWLFFHWSQQVKRQEGDCVCVGGGGQIIIITRWMQQLCDVMQTIPEQNCSMDRLT